MTSSDLGFWARTFGAVVSTPLTRSVTHVVADPQRRTSKVRQAARMAAQAAAQGRAASAVQIVDKGWLLASFSAWERAPEAPYRIVVDDEPLAVSVGDVGDRDVGGAAGVEKKPRLADLTIKDPKWALEDDDEDLIEDEEMLDELASPIEDIMADIGGDQWDQWDDELREFLEDDESDVGGDRAAPTSTPTPPDIMVTEHDDEPAGGRNKRKRDTADVEGASPRDPAAEPPLPVVVVEPESELQRRKKRAFERTSSLTQVANAAAEADADLEAGGRQTPLNSRRGGRDDEDDYDAAAMEREMLAAFEMDGEDDVKGDG
jgi:RNA polymerase II subunit A-like phosphatase